MQQRPFLHILAQHQLRVCGEIFHDAIYGMFKVRLLHSATPPSSYQTCALLFYLIWTSAFVSYCLCKRMQYMASTIQRRRTAVLLGTECAMKEMCATSTMHTLHKKPLEMAELIGATSHVCMVVTRGACRVSGGKWHDDVTTPDRL